MPAICWMTFRVLNKKCGSIWLRSCCNRLRSMRFCSSSASVFWRCNSRSISFFSCKVLTCCAIECFMRLKDSASWPISGCLGSGMSGVSNWLRLMAREASII